MNTKGVIPILLLVALAAAALTASYIFWKQSAPSVNNSEKTEEIHTITIQGTIACLPHKDKADPQTLECAIGLKADNGSYYKIKTDGDALSVSANKRVSVSGILKSPDKTEIYDIKGVIINPTIKVLDEKTENPSVDNFCGTSTYASCSTADDCVKSGCSGQVCGSKNDEPSMTTCEYRECFSAEKYEKTCGCVSGKCQWGSSVESINVDIRPIGGDRDEHGCLPAAGYTWCDAKQKCLRVWEEGCSGL